MNEDYLWDRSGPPDPEIARLERTLAPLRYRHRPESLQQPRRGRPMAWGAVAAAVLAAICTWQLTIRPVPMTNWQVAALDGSARVGSQKAANSMQVRAGQLVSTARASQITLQADALGRIEIGPDSELRADSNRMVSLNAGTLHAFIWAPPRQFVLDTPSARAVDLGCEYTITVDPSGNGLLRVAMGWVAFQVDGRESFIPAGAECATRKKRGPGIPYFSDAPEGLRDGLAGLENGDRSALDEVLASARPRDGLTLWHLLTRVSDAQRPAVFDRFAHLVKIPGGVSREGALRQDPSTIDLCWNALNLENTGWWRGWEREWK